MTAVTEPAAHPTATDTPNGAAQPFRKSIAVIIGINAYENGIPPLSTAVNDASTLAAILETQYGYEVDLLLDREATNDRITTLIESELPSRVEENDRVLFYFAGHGVARNGADGPNGYLLPADADRSTRKSYLRMPDIYDALSALACRHMLVLLDACFAGAFLWSGTREIAAEPETLTQEAYAHFVSSPAWQVITSAAQDEKALDCELSVGVLGRRDDGGEHSPFAAALIDALEHSKADLAIDGERDGVITATELFVYLSARMQAVSQTANTRQTPRLAPLRKHGSGEFVFVPPGAQLSLKPAPPPSAENNPWIGLTAYESEMAPLFFGRTAEVADVEQLIRQQPLTVVVGASGTGKSSLVKAGVLPRLQRERWHVLPVVRPGAAPLEALAKALRSDDRPAVAATPAAIRARIAELVATQSAAAPVVLVVDQFQELVTLATSDADRKTVMQLLSDLVERHDEVFRLVITVRTDFEPNFDGDAFGKKWAKSRYVMPPMSRAALRDVLEKPAAARVLYFESPTLMDAILDDVVSTPGVLPLLSFALSEMYIAWVNRPPTDRILRRDDYERSGGIAGALRQRADDVYDSLTSAEKGTMRRLLLRLVNTEEAGFARRRVAQPELFFPDPAEGARVEAVRQRLIDARLLVSGTAPDGEIFYEPAHDALIRGWGRLFKWIRRESAAPFPLPLQRQLTEAAAEWARTPEHVRDVLLWRGARAEQLAPIVERPEPWLNCTELEFTEHCLRDRRHARYARRALTVGICLLGAAAIVFGVRMRQQSKLARLTYLAATVQQLATDNPLLSSLILSSIDTAGIGKVDRKVRLSLIGSMAKLQSGLTLTQILTSRTTVDTAVLSPDHRWLIRVDSDGETSLFELDGAAREMPLTGGLHPECQTAAFDGFSTHAAIICRDEIGYIELRRGEAPLVAFFPLPATRAPRVMFSELASQLIVREEHGGLRVLDLAPARAALQRDGASPASTHTALPVLWTQDSVVTVTTASAERVIGLINLARARVWSASGSEVGTFTLPSGEGISQQSVSPDGRRLALGGLDGTVRIVDLTTRKPAATLPSRHATITALAWSPDGQRLVSATSDSVLELWAMPGDTLVRRVSRDAGVINAIAWSPDGAYMIGRAEENDQAILFDSAGVLARIPGSNGRLLAAEWGPNRQLITVTRAGGVAMWRIPLSLSRAPSGPGARTIALAVTPHADRIVTADGTGAIYDHGDGSRGRPQRVAQRAAHVFALHWSTDGSELRALFEDGRRRRWSGGPSLLQRADESSRFPFRLIQRAASGADFAVAFSPAAGRATLWNLADQSEPLVVPFASPDTSCQVAGARTPGARPATQRECDPRVRYCATLSADAQWLGLCAADAIELKPARNAASAPTIRIRTPNVIDLTLSRDGQLAAVQLRNGAVRLVRRDAPRDTGRVFSLCARTTNHLTFAPDGKRLAYLCDDGVIRVMDLKRETLVFEGRPVPSSVDILLFSRDGRLLLSAARSAPGARVWDIQSGSFFPLSTGTGNVSEAEMSADGQWVVLANDRQEVYRHPLDVAVGLKSFRAITGCLSTAQRAQLLFEELPTAMKGERACQLGLSMRSSAARRDGT